MKLSWTTAVIFFFSCAVHNLHAQQPPREMLKTAWALLPTDQTAADSIAYLLLNTIKQSDPPNDTLHVEAFYLLGTLEFYKKRYRISANFYEQALATNYIRNNKPARLNCLNNLGGSLMRLGKIPEALGAFHKAMSLSQELQDQASIEDLRINIAELECELGEYDQAIALASMALKAASQRQDTFKMATCHLNLGKYHIFKKQLEQGELHNQTAIRHFEYLNDPYNLIAALINQSRIEQLKKNHEASNQLLQRIIGIVETENYKNSLAPVYIHLAENAMVPGASDVHKAAGYAREAIRLSELSGRRDHLEEATLLLSKYFAKINDIDSFDSTIDKYNDIKRETAALSARAASEELKIMYNLDDLNNRNLQLQQNVQSKNQQMLLLSLGLLLASGAGGIIFLQHRKLKRNVKTMFQMNVNLAYAEHGNASGPAELPDPSIELSDSDLYKLILKKIETRELYRDPSLGAQDLARHVKRSRLAVSRAIKNVGKTNFAGLINEFKVNEARRLFMEQGNKLSISDIAAASGFSSRTSFNRHFKDLTGFTPTAYLELLNGAVTENETEGDEP